MRQRARSGRRVVPSLRPDDLDVSPASATKRGSLCSRSAVKRQLDVINEVHILVIARIQ